MRKGSGRAQTSRFSPGLTDPRQELNYVLSRLFDIMYPVGIILGGIALAFSAYRSLQHGLSGTLLLHVSMYLFAVVILIFRRRIHVTSIFAVLLSLIAIDVVQSLLTTGLASAAMTSLAFACVFASVFLGVRAGILAVTLGVLVASSIGAGVCTGILTMRPGFADHLLERSTWVIQISLLVTYSVPLIIAVDLMKKRMVRSVDEIRTANERLRDEIWKTKIVEDELRRREEKYRGIYENAVMGMFQTTPEGNIISANPALARIHGYNSPEEMIREIADLGRQLYVERDRRFEFIRLMNAEGSASDFEARTYRRDGSLAWIAISARTVRDDDGDPLYYEGTVEDITARKSSEKALRESERRFREFADLLPQTVTEFDAMGNVTFSNRNGFETFGYTRDDLEKGINVLQLVIPEDRDRAGRNIERVLRENTGIADNEYMAMRKDGTQFPIAVYTSPVVHDGKPAGFRSIVIDITEKRHLEAQLLQTQKMESVGTLAGGIAHDFNNILTVITGYSALLQMKVDDGSPLEPYIGKVRLAARKATDLVKGLLTFSRKQPATLVPLNVNKAIRATEDLLMRLLTEDIQMRLSLSRESTIIMADKTQMDQILFNLVSNARDAMPKGGVITIKTDIACVDNEFARIHGFGEPGRYVLIRVSDTGTGMDEETKEKIFDPFFTTKEIGKGTGLGLATVYGIIKRHGGYITVDSELDRGSTFSIYIPLTDQETDGAEDRAAAIPTGNETILLAEDDRDVRLMVAEILAGHGYTVIEAVDGQDAIHRFTDGGDIDLAILDSVMPGKNGREAHDEMQLLKPGIPTIFISGYTRDIVLDKGVEEGKVNFIAKPILPEQLLKKVRDVLDGAAAG